MNSINWNEIQENYKKSAEILMEGTEETRTGLRDGLDKSTEHLKQKRRTEIVRLRMAAEYLIKSLFIKKGYSIFKIKNKFLTISDIGSPSEIDLDRTHDFSYLIAKLKLIIQDQETLKKLKRGLEDIRKRGNESVHGSDFNDQEIEEAKETLRILKEQF